MHQYYAALLGLATLRVLSPCVNLVLYCLLLISWLAHEVKALTKRIKFSRVKFGALESQHPVVSTVSQV
jgi:hypothetical protein